MGIILKRILLSIAGGSFLQLLVYSLFAVFGAGWLAVIFLFPGWVFGFAGRDESQSWFSYIVSWTVMIAVNDLLYSTLIYFLLWNRALTKESLRKSFP
jgi:hypothetical protein